MQKSRDQATSLRLPIGFIVISSYMYYSIFTCGPRYVYRNIQGVPVEFLNSWVPHNCVLVARLRQWLLVPKWFLETQSVVFVVTFCGTQFSKFSASQPHTPYRARYRCDEASDAFYKCPIKMEPNSRAALPVSSGHFLYEKTNEVRLTLNR